MVIPKEADPALLSDKYNACAYKVTSILPQPSTAPTGSIDNTRVHQTEATKPGEETRQSIPPPYEMIYSIEGVYGVTSKENLNIAGGC